MAKASLGLLERKTLIERSVQQQDMGVETEIWV
jgi:hypothetical protein